MAASPSTRPRSPCWRLPARRGRGRPITIGLIIRAAMRQAGLARSRSRSWPCGTATRASSQFDIAGTSGRYPPTRHLDAFHLIAASRCRTASSAISTERAAWRMAVMMSPIVIGRPSAPRGSRPASQRHLVEGEATIGQQLGRHPDLGVHDAIGCQVLRALGRHPLDRIGAA